MPRGHVQALGSAAALDEYTYGVAGCVGEFWTELCFRHLPDFARLPKPQMRELGRGFGMALQLVNILRDLGADLRRGPLLLSRRRTGGGGISPLDIAGEPERFEPSGSTGMRTRRHGLELGMRYARGREQPSRAGRQRPARTARRAHAGALQAAGPQRLRNAVKVPRGEVRSLDVPARA